MFLLGWFIAWIDQQEEIKKQEAFHKVKAIHDDEERMQQLLREQAERYAFIIRYLLLEFSANLQPSFLSMKL